MAPKTPLEAGETVVKEARPTRIPLANLTEVRKTWTRFLGAIPIVPNSIAVRTIDDEVYRVVVGKRDDWIEAIDAQRGAAA
jgi:hypothetical protein